MAVGARSRDILSQFLVEAVTLSLARRRLRRRCSGSRRCAIGQFAGWPTDLDIGAIVLALGFASAVGVFFGFYPARKASRLIPDRGAALRVSSDEWPMIDVRSVQSLITCHESLL